MPLVDFVTGMKFNPIAYQPNNADVQQLGKTYETLRQMDDGAMANKTKLESTIANAPLDESEEWYKHMILDTIENSSNKLSDEFGLAGAAEKINSLVADITNSKEFRGKVAANVAHKAFVEKIRNDKNLSQIEKEYYLEKNPYKYDNNLVDENGKEVMYNWDDDPNRIDVIYMADMDDLLKQTLSNVAARRYGDDHDLNMPFNLASVDIPGFQGQQFLPEDEIYVGMLNVIAANPKVKEGFKRKYEIGKWHDEKYADNKWEMQTNRQIPIDPATGLTMDYDKWLDGLLIPYVKTAAYYTGYSPAQLKTLGVVDTRGRTTVKLTEAQKEAKAQQKAQQKAKEKIKANKTKNNAGRVAKKGQTVNSNGKTISTRKGGRN